MSWKEVGKSVAKFAPLIGAALPIPGGAAIGSIIASVFGTEDNPDAILKALETDPEAAIKLRQIEVDYKVKLEELLMLRAKNELEADTNRIIAVNNTMQAEASASDPWTRRWRPYFGFVVATTWGITWLAVCGTIVFSPQDAPEILTALGATMAMWGIALSVLGVAVYKRSHDKEVMAGMKPGFLSGINKG